MAITAEMNMMMAQLNSLTAATLSHTSTLSHEQVNEFSGLGLSPKSLKEHYSELNIAGWKESKLYFGDEFKNLPEATFHKTPSPEVLAYVQQRKKTLDDLVKVFGLAMRAAKPEQAPALLSGFLTMCGDARSEAIKGNTKGLDSMESVHVIELEKAALKAANGDEHLLALLSRDPKAYINNPILMQATLKVLTERQTALAGLESAYNKNAVKNGGAGHVADFFREEWMPLALTGSYFRKVKVLDKFGNPIIEELTHNGKLLKPFWNEKVLKHIVGRGPDGIKPIVANLPKEGIETIYKKRLAIGQSFSNICRWPENIAKWFGNLGPNLETLGKRIPGGKLGKVALGIGIVWAGCETVCFMANNPKWSKPITDGYTRLTENYSNPLGFFADWFIPDPGKLVGRPVWTSESLNHIKREFKDL